MEWPKKVDLVLPTESARTAHALQPLEKGPHTRSKRSIRYLKSKMREPLAEFFATTLLIFLGDAAVTQVYLGAGTTSAGSFLNIVVAWGIALTLASIIALPVAAVHLNPASTITFALFRGFPKRKLVPTIVAQLFGGFAAALLLISLYPNLPRLEETRMLFSTYPQPNISLLVAFWNEVLATAVIHVVAMATSDPRHKMHPITASVTMGASLIVIGLSMGLQTGYALNPARDFGPRLVSFIFGWGADVFTHRQYAWIPIVGPLIGGPLGGAVYYIFLGLEDETDVSESAIEAKLQHMIV